MTKRRDDLNETAVSRRSALKAGLTGTLVLGGIGGITGATAAQSNGNGNGRGNGNSESDTLVVDDNGNADYETVQAAVDEAGKGDTIEVRPGEYTGGVTLDEDELTLMGRGNATVEGGGQAAITVDADGVTVERLQVSNPDEKTGIGVEPDHEDVTIRNNEVSDVGPEQPKDSGAPGVNGIVVQANQDDLAIVDNEVSELRGGSQVAQAIFLDNQNGDSVSGRVAGNEISDVESNSGAIGVLLQATGATVEENDISELSGSYAQGVNFDTTGGNGITLESNDIDDVSASDFDGEAIKIDGGDLSTFTITANSLLAPVGINNAVPTEVDAECNYWGARSGPDAPGNDGEGSEVKGDVDYTPWKVGRGGGSGNCRGGT